jgi:hypothetical protein
MSHTTEGHERKRADETDDGGEIILQIGFNLKKIKMIFRIYARLWETDVKEEQTPISQSKDSDRHERTESSNPDHA